MYKTPKEADRAYYLRHRDRIIKTEANRRKNRKKPPELEGKKFWQAPVSLQQRLEEACQANYDASVEPIEALLAQGCDLEADVLPTVARTVPELPRPLKNWGAQWLVQEILAARDRRLQARVRDLCLDRALSLDEAPREPPEPLERPEPPSYATPELLAAVTFKEVEAPPPARRLSAMDWDEFVAGHRAGLIEWNTARLSPDR
jgi:hypothetical protein